MKEYLPYIVSVLTALLSFFGALLVSKKNNKAEINKMKLEHEQKMERAKQEQDARIAQLEKEYALKTEMQMVTEITGKTYDAVVNSKPVQDEINKQVYKKFATQKGRGKKR